MEYRRSTLTPFPSDSSILSFKYDRSLKIRLNSTYLNRISENHTVNIHIDKIRNVQTDRHRPKINGASRKHAYIIFPP